MFPNRHRFEEPAQNSRKNIIKVVGVGGGGTNAVNHMFRQGINGVEFAVLNTDAQALDDSPVKVKVQLGEKLTEGLGAGTDPDQGKKAAEESKEDIKKLLSDGTKMVFITAGMGGGTGTGAAPVVASIAKECGLLTVAIVTAPYDWEGLDKINAAAKGINELQDACDTVLVVLNDKLIELYPEDDIFSAFARADDVLLIAAKSIAEVITTIGKINIDFKDVKTVLTKAGQAVMGSAEAKGSDRAMKAITAALDSPLLNNREIKGAQRVLVSVAFGSKFIMKGAEQRQITDYIQSKIESQARGVKLGMIVDDALEDFMRVTVIVAGFHLPPEREIKLIVVEPEEKPVIAPPPPPPVIDEPVRPSINNGISHTHNGFIPPVEIKNQPRTIDESISHPYRYQQPNDRDHIRNMIERFTKQKSSDRELDSPAYIRYGVPTIDLSQISPLEFKRYSLND
jgi:cell division protein FtsZ